MPELYDSNYFRGQGPLYIGSRDSAGEPSGLIFVGDVSEASLTPNIERSEKLENVTGGSAVAISTLKRVQYNISLKLDSVKPEHLALAISGTSTAKAAASVADEAHTAYLDKHTRLQHTNVSSVVVTGSGGSPTYVKDTDYVEHLDEGIIEFISGGTITDSTAVEISYDYAAQHHVKSDPGQTERYLVFSGINTANNDKRMRCEVYRCKLDPGVLSLITADVDGITLNGVIELDSLRAAGDQLYSWKIED